MFSKCFWCYCKNGITWKSVFQLLASSCKTGWYSCFIRWGLGKALSLFRWWVLRTGWTNASNFFRKTRTYCANLSATVQSISNQQTNCLFIQTTFSFFSVKYFWSGISKSARCTAECQTNWICYREPIALSKSEILFHIIAANEDIKWIKISIN